MGSLPSKSGMIRSSSAAFGRLRIDSPQSTPRGRQRILHHRQARLLAAHQDGGRVPGLSLEASPLIIKQAYQHDVRQLLSIESIASSESSMASPPLAVWIIPALCCALAYAL